MLFASRSSRELYWRLPAGETPRIYASAERGTENVLGRDPTHAEVILGAEPRWVSGAKFTAPAIGEPSLHVHPASPTVHRREDAGSPLSRGGRASRPVADQYKGSLAWLRF
jgi:hypothetical protein